jgi:hypothetical protein
MQFQPATLATLRQLEEADWFKRVGQCLIDEGEITVPVVIVSSWEEAMEQCSSNEWGLTLNELTNSYCRELVRKSPEDFRTWNERAKAVKTLSGPLVKAKFAPVRIEHNLSEEFEGMVHAQVAMVFMEAEYAHVIPPASFSKLAFWFVNGHVPCGWKGEFPNGNLIIF